MRWLGMDQPDWRQMVLTLLAIIIGMVMLVSLLLIARYRPPKKDEAALLFQKFVRRNGINPSLGETPQRYGRRLASEHNLVGTEALIDQYLETRYGPPRAGAMEELRSAVKRYVAKSA